MTEASPAPTDGWADVPRPPIEVTLDAGQVRLIRVAAVRATQARPAVLRVAVAVVLAGFVALIRGPSVGLLTGVALLALGLVPVLLTMRLVNRAVAPGALRATGYDLLGRFVVLGSSRVVLPAGWASSVAERDGLVTIRPRRRGAVPVVLLRELVTEEDEAYLRDDVAAAAADASLTREVVVTPELRHAVWRAVLGRIVSRPVLVLLVVLVAVEAVIAGDLPTSWRIAFAVVPVLAVLGAAPLFLWVLVRRWLPVGSTLRSGVVGESLRVSGSRLFPEELRLDAVRVARTDGVVTRVRSPAGVIVALPSALVPEQLPSP